MIVKAVLASAILVASFSAALADRVVGKILAFDRQAKLIILEDKTVWTLAGAADNAVPADLKSGDRVEINYESGGDDGLRKIDAIKVVQ